MKVNNINGTSGKACNCGSWLSHWKNFSGQALPQYCAEKTCTGKPELGAHVQKDSSADRGWYIVPLCKEHNGQTGSSLSVGDYVALVSANASETCGK